MHPATARAFQPRIDGRDEIDTADVGFDTGKSRPSRNGTRYRHHDHVRLHQCGTRGFANMRLTYGKWIGVNRSEAARQQGPVHGVERRRWGLYSAAARDGEDLP